MSEAQFEKVCKGLEVHIKPNSRCVGCPYPNNGMCGDQLYSDALDLIRQQQERIAELEAELWQRDYNAAVEMQQYCERYEPTYNPEDGSM
jgi:hypothetical protein